MFRQFIENIGLLATNAICVWFVFWAFRYRAELDRQLDAVAQRVRWGIVVAGLILGAIPFSGLGPLKGTAVVLGLVFFCWPNFAYHVTQLFRRMLRISREHP
jgi:hypothetical protein